jgi:hypothetical protein
LNSIDNLVCHNTFVGSAYAVAFHQGKAGNRVLNNIVQDGAKSFLVWPAKALPQTLDSNLYYNSSAAPRWERDGVAYPTFAAYQQAAGETHSRYAAPQLVGPGDAHLQPGSPAIDGGAAQQEVAVDLDGIARPQGAGWDLGAYEFKINTK